MNMDQLMQVDGGDGTNQGGERKPQQREWTLDHHKQLVDAVVRAGLRDIQDFTSKGSETRRLITDLRTVVFKDLGLSSIGLFMGFRLLQKRTHDALSGGGLSGMFERLNVGGGGGEPRLLSWTVDHHVKFVEAVEKEGGLWEAKPAGILRRMEEERRRGLTVGIVRRHLFELKKFQSNTQKNLGAIKIMRRNIKCVKR